MKKRWIALFMVICIMLIHFSDAVAFAEEESQYTISSPYVYPVQPGTTEWLSLPSVVERRAACDVPTDVLTGLTTYALAETVVTYPFITDILCFNSFEQGLQWVSHYYSGIDELLSRTDAIDCLREYLVNEEDFFAECSEIALEERTREESGKYSAYIIARLMTQYLEEEK